MKKILALMPLLVLGLFMSWMQKHFYGIIVVEPQIGQVLQVSIDGETFEIDEKTKIRVWAREHDVLIQSESFEDKMMKVAVGYHEEVVLDLDLSIAVGLEEVSRTVPYFLKNEYSQRGDYKDNLLETVLEFGDSDLAPKGLGEYFADVYQSYFSPNLLQVFVKKGDLLNQKLALYDLESEKEIFEIEDAVSVDWANDSSFAVVSAYDDEVTKLYVVSMDGSVKLLKSIPGIGRVTVSLSDAGDRVVLQQMGQLPERNLYVVNVVDAKIKQITDTGFVYGFKWFANDDMLLIERSGEGTSLKRLWTKHLSSGEEKMLDIVIPLEKVFAQKGSLLFARSDDPDFVANDSLEAMDLIEEIGEKIKGVDVTEDRVYPEQFYVYDLITEEEELLHRNFLQAISTEKIIAGENDMSVYVLSDDRLYLLTYEL